ncbi:MAG TPA: hypothetical protein V6C76_02175 [Drouetiella sp.]
MNPSPLLVNTNFMVAQPPTDEQNQSAFAPVQQEPQSVIDLQNRVFELEQELELVRMKGKLLSQETDLFRQRRIVYWSDRFRNTFDAWNLMNPGFLQLKDDTAIFNSSLNGFRLQASLSLLRVAFLTYTIDLKKPNLNSILLAPIVDVPLTSGELCIRIFEAPDTFVTSAIASVADIRDDKPLQFDFEPIKNSDKPLIIRVHVQGVDAPVRIFEMRKYGLGGFGRQYNKLFAGFQFQDE